MAMNLSQIESQLQAFAKKRVYWFRSGSFEDLVTPWLSNASDVELSRLQARVNAYLNRNAVLRFFEWLFSSIEYDLRLLSYYQTKQMLAEPTLASEQQKQNLHRMVAAMHSSSAWQVLSQSFLTSMDGVGAGRVPALNKTEAIIARPMPLLLESSSDLDKIYEILGIADPAMAGLDVIVKAYRDKARSCHPDRGGEKEAFAKLTQAYLLAVYIRVHYFEEKDERGILKEEDLPALSAESVKYFASIRHLMLAYLEGKLEQVKATTARAMTMIAEVTAGIAEFRTDLARLRAAKASAALARSTTELCNEGPLPALEPEPASALASTSPAVGAGAR